MLPMMLVFALSLVLVLVCSAMPWLTRHLRGQLLVIALVVGLVVGITAGVMGAVRALPLAPVTDLMVLVVAWSGGRCWDGACQGASDLSCSGSSASV